MKTLTAKGALAAALLAPALMFGAGAAQAETSCSLETELVGVVGSAITGGTSQLIWIIQQCVDDDGAVRTTARLCELDDEINPAVAPKCSAPAELGDAVSKP